MPRLVNGFLDGFGRNLCSIEINGHVGGIQMRLSLFYTRQSLDSFFHMCFAMIALHSFNFKCFCCHNQFSFVFKFIVGKGSAFPDWRITKLWIVVTTFCYYGGGFFEIFLNSMEIAAEFVVYLQANSCKKQRIMTGIIILIVVVLLALWLISIYNRLVKLRNNRENAFANIDVQLKQRHDLVPQLVATVKGYATHERELLEKVTEARAQAMGATTMDDKIAAENSLTAALSGLKVSLEAYPDLKANQNFLQLQNELADIENKLAAVRRFFNSATRELNNAVQTFPSNLIAGMFGFKTEPMFEIPTEQRAELDKAPEVKF